MSQLSDGVRVAYVGDDDDLVVGDEGVVMLASKGASHVKMVTGKRLGSIFLIPNDDLVVESSTRGDFDDSLSYGSLLDIDVRGIFDRGGEAHLARALSKEGHLSSLAAAAEDAVANFAQWIRNDPSMREAIAALDEDEASALVSHIAVTLLREAVE